MTTQETAWELHSRLGHDQDQILVLSLTSYVSFHNLLKLSSSAFSSIKHIVLIIHVPPNDCEKESTEYNALHIESTDSC